jgi:signal recognition particle subunit SEC65
MTRSIVERRLAEVTKRLRKAREELAVVEEQRAALAEVADDLRIRAVVAETPYAEREHREAQRHVERMDASKNELAKRIADLQRSQDELLDRLVTEPH